MANKMVNGKVVPLTAEEEQERADAAIAFAAKPTVTVEDDHYSHDPLIRWLVKELARLSPLETERDLLSRFRVEIDSGSVPPPRP